MPVVYKKGLLEGTRVTMVPREAISPNPDQPRRYFDPQALGELADSIRVHGILQPLSVRRKGGGRYELIAGERRLRAAALCGLQEVPCLVLEADRRDSCLLSLVENLQRRDLHYLEEAEAIDVNLTGTIRFTQLFVESPALRSVLFIASASARNGAEFPLYVASKAGLVGYMKNLALALSKRGVTVNSISPGGVITPANRHILESESLYAAVKAETLLGKWAEAEEIAELAWFLTHVNRSVTGEDILIDNGEMLKSNFIW